MDKSRLHPLVEHCMRTLALPSSALGDDGDVSMLVDDSFRIHLIPVESGWLCVKSRLCALSAPGKERDAQLIRLGKFAMAMLRGSVGALAIDEQEDSLHLQQMLRPDCRAESLPETLGDFVNALEKWRSFASAGERS
ncbi:Tir chaperone protein (CesT) [compost metagenome]